MRDMELRHTPARGWKVVNAPTSSAAWLAPAATRHAHLAGSPAVPERCSIGRPAVFQTGPRRARALWVTQRSRGTLAPRTRFVQPVGVIVTACSPLLDPGTETGARSRTPTCACCGTCSGIRHIPPTPEWPIRSCHADVECRSGTSRFWLHHRHAARSGRVRPAPTHCRWGVSGPAGRFPQCASCHRGTAPSRARATLAAGAGVVAGVARCAWRESGPAGSPAARGRPAHGDRAPVTAFGDRGGSAPGDQASDCCRGARYGPGRPRFRGWSGASVRARRSPASRSVPASRQTSGWRWDSSGKVRFTAPISPPAWADPIAASSPTAFEPSDRRLLTC